MVIESQFLPCIAYFTLLKKHSEVTLDTHSWFEKQTYRNRTSILGSGKVETLTAAVSGGRKKILLKDIKLDHSSTPLIKIWRAIATNYGKAPFFDFFGDYFSLEFSKNPSYLIELNHALLTICLKLLQIDTHITYSESFINSSKLDLNDYRNKIHPKFSHFTDKIYNPYAYVQLFGNNFVPNLSIIDTLMCEGPGAASIVTRSTKENEQII